MRANSISKAAAALLLVVLAWPAQAVFHLMKIVEVFPGTAAAPNAQYVVLQMHAGGQNLVGGHQVIVYNAAGTVIATFTFPGNVSNGANQAKILIATPEAVAFFGVNADLTMSAAILSAGGKVCFADTIDCVAWGAYTGTAAGVGTPFNATGGGLVSGRAAIRRLDISGSPTVLEGGDDTNNCATDFVSGLPAPRNNAGMMGTIPAATCGNGAVEGLEQCDDGNLSNNDSCSSTCMVQTPPYHPVGDYNGDSISDLLWRNGSNGANAIWRSANSAIPQTVTTVANLSWKVVGRGDFDGDGKADIFWRNTSTGANTIWKSANSSTQQSTTAVTNLSWQMAGVGDFNGDGKDDALWRNGSSGANVIWRSANSATPQAVATVASLSWKIGGVGDFNGDDKADVFWRNTSTGANMVWLSANAGTQVATTTVASQTWQVAGIGDFNNDGKDDVLWRNNSTGSNVIWRSASSSSQQTVATVGNLSWKVEDVADFNGDHASDICWRNGSTGANVIWRSANSATQQAVTGLAAPAWDIVP